MRVRRVAPRGRGPVRACTRVLGYGGKAEYLHIYTTATRTHTHTYIYTQPNNFKSHKDRDRGGLSSPRPTRPSSLLSPTASASPRYGAPLRSSATTTHHHMMITLSHKSKSSLCIFIAANCRVPSKGRLLRKVIHIHMYIRHIYINIEKLITRVDPRLFAL